MAEKEYIEREAIEKAFAKEIHTNYLDDYAKGFQAALLAVMSIPAADVAPVNHGEWKNNDGIAMCSECGYIPPYDNAIDDIFYSNYCPNCGAKMDA